LIKRNGGTDINVLTKIKYRGEEMRMIDRYVIDYIDNDVDLDEEGYWVTYDDYEILEKKYERLKELYAEVIKNI
jgi:hypothetical protein